MSDSGRDTVERLLAERELGQAIGARAPVLLRVISRGWLRARVPGGTAALDEQDKAE